MGVFICQRCGSEDSASSGQCPTCGNTERIKIATRKDRLLDQVVDGRYRILRKLGQGGMGAVYLAEQLGLGHRVALKFLKAELADDPEIVRRFLNEAKSYALVAHPNAIVLHELRQDEEGHLFIAMEYFEGTDLKRLLAEQGRLPLAEAAEIILQVADVLGYAHTRGVVHRDLKPENVMVRKGLHGLHVKVLDFGIARLMGESTHLTAQGSIAGTPRYMAPEQVEGREIDHRVDVYALGLVFFELLTGAQPFDGGSVAEILRNQVAKPMPRLAEVAPELDLPEIDSVIQIAAAKSREQRFGDMTAFAHALGQTLPTLAQLSAPSVATLRAAGGPRSLATGRLEELPSPPVQDSSISPRGSPKLGLGAVGLGLLAVGGVAAVVAWGSLRVPTQGEVAAPTGKANPAPSVPPEEVSALVRDLRGSDRLADARASFKAGELERARVYLKEVPGDSPYRSEAAALLRVIEDLEQRLERARALYARGDCEGAVRGFKEILQINPGLAAAHQGIERCRSAQRPATLE